MQTLITAAAAPRQVFPPSAELALTLLGPSPAMSQLWSQIRRLAPHMRTLLLTGAPDCGQEAIARLLLDLSPQPRRLFLNISAAEAEDRLNRALAPNGLPTEVFLFFPDVDRLSTEAQESLLQLLRSRRPNTLTLVAATTEGLRTLVSLGRFDPELAEVLSAVRIEVPALKDRAEDLPMLLNQMIYAHCQAKHRAAPPISEPLLRAAMQHAWPGNLKDLSDAVEELLSGNDRMELDLAAWTRALNRQRSHRSTSSAVRLISLDAVVQEHISTVLRACGGNKQKAADVLGISRSTLYRMLDAPVGETALALAC